jgi:hypothetical protein
MTGLPSTDRVNFIEFLVRRKYPSPRVSRAPRPFGRAYGYSDARESEAEARRDKEVSEYREALRALPAEEFAALLNSDQVKEASEIQAKAAAVEKARFFNQPHANADISFGDYPFDAGSR